MKNRWLDEHCDSLDADVFTGDALFDKDDMKEFEAYLARWARKVAEIKQMVAEMEAEEAAHTEPAIGDEVCINCHVELNVLDEDPNGAKNPVCAKCRAEEAHDFDAEPNAVFGRDGHRIDV